MQSNTDQFKLVKRKANQKSYKVKNDRAVSNKEYINFVRQYVKNIRYEGI